MDDHDLWITHHMTVMASPAPRQGRETVSNVEASDPLQFSLPPIGRPAQAGDEGNAARL